MTSVAELRAQRSPTASAWITWLRWIGVLPGAFVTASIANSLFSALFVAVLGVTPSAILLPFCVAAVFVMAGSIIAPRIKVKTALALIAFYVLLGIIALVVLWSGTDIPGLEVEMQGGSTWVSVLGTLSAILGLLCALHWVRIDEARHAQRNRTSVHAPPARQRLFTIDM